MNLNCNLSLSYILKYMNVCIETMPDKLDSGTCQHRRPDGIKRDSQDTGKAPREHGSDGATQIDVRTIRLKQVGPRHCVDHAAPETRRTTEDGFEERHDKGERGRGPPSADSGGFIKQAQIYNSQRLAYPSESLGFLLLASPVARNRLSSAT